MVESYCCPVRYPLDQTYLTDCIYGEAEIIQELLNCKIRLPLLQHFFGGTFNSWYFSANKHYLVYLVNHHLAITLPSAHLSECDFVITFFSKFCVTLIR